METDTYVVHVCINFRAVNLTRSWHNELAMDNVLPEHDEFVQYVSTAVVFELVNFAGIFHIRIRARFKLLWTSMINSVSATKSIF